MNINPCRNINHFLEVSEEFLFDSITVTCIVVHWECPVTRPAGSVLEFCPGRTGDVREGVGVGNIDANGGIGLVVPAIGLQNFAAQLLMVNIGI